MIYYKIPPLIEEISESFILVKSKNNKHQLNQTVHLSDYTNTYLGTFFIVSTKTILLKDIDVSFCYLHLNVNKKIYLQIMQYRGFKLDQYIDILVLSNKTYDYD
jgi:hypothetical protein